MVKGQNLNFLKESSPIAIKLGFDFSVTMQEKNNENVIEIITIIEQLHTIGRNKIKNGF